MNREDTRKAAEVMLHYANGGEVQLKASSQSEWASYGDSPHWDWERCEYRIKPQPVEVKAWAVVHGPLSRNWTFHETLPLATARLHEVRHCSKDAFVVELKGTYTCES